MKSIVFTEPNVAKLLDESIPELEGGHVTVKLARSTISAGTERANLVGDPNVSYGTNIVPFPRRGGYSSVGTVSAVADDVTSVKVGDRVACSWSKHSQFTKVKASATYPVDEQISDKAAALVHIATFPMAAIRKCKLEVGESAMVMGLGVLGIIAVKLLRASGAAPIIAVDPQAEKREFALKIGADYALNPFDENFAEEVKRISDGGAKVVIEVTGKGQGLDMALDCTARFGRVALLGCTRNSNFTIDYYRKVHAPGITLIGAHTMARPVHESYEGWWTERDDALSIIKLIKYGRLDLESLVEETHSPSEAPEVYTRLATEPSFPVVQFDWSLLKE